MLNQSAAMRRATTPRSILFFIRTTYLSLQQDGGDSGTWARAGRPPDSSLHRVLYWAGMVDSERPLSEWSPCCADCGGCPLSSLTLDEQHRGKRARLEQALLEQGLEPRVVPIDWVRSPRTLGYRNRVRLRVDADDGLGFFNPKKSRRCPVLDPRLFPLMDELTEFVARHPPVRSAIAHLEVRAPDADGSPAVYLTPRNGWRSFDAALKAPLEELSPEFLVAVEGHGSPSERPCQRFRLPGATLWVPLGSFLQVNEGTNRLLVERVVEGASERGLSSFADLYAGSGNFALPLLAAGLAGIAVERDEAAVTATRRSLAAAGLGGRAVVADAVAWADALAEPERMFDLLVLDPPRAGVGPRLEPMSLLAQRAIAMSSCNPHTLARDLARLVSVGFTLCSLSLLDMFPHTEHVEILAWLARETKGRPRPAQTSSRGESTVCTSVRNGATGKPYSS
jgi:23S rRNA (uracil1939-C5)-methyltransferase